MLSRIHPTQQGWRAGLEEIRAYKAELAENMRFMTNYEYRTAEKILKETVDRHRQNILDGLFQEQEAAIENYRQAHEAVKKAKKAEVNRWDASRLLAEMHLAEAQIEQEIKIGATGIGGREPTGKRLQQLYAEAQASDPVKARAICEVMRGIMAKLGNQTDKETQIIANSLSFQAERDLAQMHVTAEIQSAKEAEFEKFSKLRETQEFVKSVGCEVEGTRLDDPNSFVMTSPLSYTAQLYRRATVDPESGELTIHDWDELQNNSVHFRETFKAGG